MAPLLSGPTLVPLRQRRCRGSELEDLEPFFWMPLRSTVGSTGSSMIVWVAGWQEGGMPASSRCIGSTWIAVAHSLGSYVRTRTVLQTRSSKGPAVSLQVHRTVLLIAHVRLYVIYRNVVVSFAFKVPRLSQERRFFVLHQDQIINHTIHSPLQTALSLSIYKLQTCLTKFSSSKPTLILSTKLFLHLTPLPKATSPTVSMRWSSAPLSRSTARSRKSHSQETTTLESSVASDPSPTPMLNL